MFNMKSAAPSFPLLKLGVLALLVVQTVCNVMLLKYTRITTGPSYVVSTAIVLQELLKLVGLVVILSYRTFCSTSGSIVFRVASGIKYNWKVVSQHPSDMIKLSLPGLLFAVQANLNFYALSNLEAPLYQVALFFFFFGTIFTVDMFVRRVFVCVVFVSLQATHQTKLLAVAMFSVLMLNRRFSMLQWFALLMLMIGVVCVNMAEPDSSTQRNIGENHVSGLVALLLAVLSSSFCAPYLEKLLKDSSMGFLERNLQIAVVGLTFDLLVMTKDLEMLRNDGFFYGYTWVVMLVVLVQASGGLIISATMKYADSVLKGFAAAFSLLVNIGLSIIFFDYHISWNFFIGAAMVCCSIVLYSLPAQKKEINLNDGQTQESNKN